MSESKSSTTAAKPEPRLVAESIEFLGTHRAEIGVSSEAGEITSETAFDAAYRFNVHAALVEALEKAERIERLYSERSENLARVNSRQGTAESMILSKKRLAEIEVELREIRNTMNAALAAAKGTR